LCYLGLPLPARLTLWEIQVWCEIRSIFSLEWVSPASAEWSQKIVIGVRRASASDAPIQMRMGMMM
jgi:hypothetical protein